MITYVSKRGPSRDDGNFMQRVAVLGVVSDERVAALVVSRHQVDFLVRNTRLLFRA
jgi:hypothetical protein